MKKTYYDLLGVSRDAPADDIKSQYRRLAKRCHPDLNPNNTRAADEFRALNAAYTVLSDDAARQAYDATLAPAKPPKPKFTGSDDWLDDWLMSVINANMRQTANHTTDEPQPRPHRSRARFQTKPTQPRGAYLRYDLELRVQDLFKGARRNLIIGETSRCRKCKGLPTTPTCSACDGYGFVVSPHTIDVDVPAGVLPGMSMRVEVAHDNKGVTPYASYVTVTFTLPADTPFSYDGANLHTTVNVPADTLCAGGEHTIPAPDGGAAITLTIPAGTQSGTNLTVRKRGLPNGASHRRGNLICTVVAETEKAAA